MKWLNRVGIFALLFAACGLAAQAQGKGKVIIDQDAAGPGGTDMQSIVALASQW
jgi:hypothetical protein